MAELDGVWRLVDITEHKRRYANSAPLPGELPPEKWFCISGSDVSGGCAEEVWRTHNEIWLLCVGRHLCQPFCVCLDCWPVTAASRRLLLAFSGADGG